MKHFSHQFGFRIAEQRLLRFSLAPTPTPEFRPESVDIPLDAGKDLPKADLGESPDKAAAETDVREEKAEAGITDNADAFDAEVGKAEQLQLTPEEMRDAAQNALKSVSGFAHTVGSNTDGFIRDAADSVRDFTRAGADAVGRIDTSAKPAAEAKTEQKTEGLIGEQQLSEAGVSQEEFDAAKQMYTGLDDAQVLDMVRQGVTNRKTEQPAAETKTEQKTEQQIGEQQLSEAGVSQEEFDAAKQMYTGLDDAQVLDMARQGVTNRKTEQPAAETKTEQKTEQQIGEQQLSEAGVSQEEFDAAKQMYTGLDDAQVLDMARQGLTGTKTEQPVAEATPEPAIETTVEPPVEFTTLEPAVEIDPIAPPAEGPAAQTGQLAAEGPAEAAPVKPAADKPVETAAVKPADAVDAATTPEGGKKLSRSVQNRVDDINKELGTKKQELAELEKATPPNKEKVKTAKDSIAALEDELENLTKEPETKGDKLEQDISRALLELNEANSPAEAMKQLFKILANLMQYFKGAVDGTLEDPIKKPGQSPEGGGNKPPEVAAADPEKARDDRLEQEIAALGGKPEKNPEAKPATTETSTDKPAESTSESAEGGTRVEKITELQEQKREEIGENKEGITALESQIDSKKEANGKLINDKAALESRINNLQGTDDKGEQIELRGLEAELKTLEGQMNLNKDLIKELDKQSDDLDKQNAELQKDIDRLEKKKTEPEKKDQSKETSENIVKAKEFSKKVLNSLNELLARKFPGVAPEFKLEFNDKNEAVVTLSNLTDDFNKSLSPALVSQIKDSTLTLDGGQFIALAQDTLPVQAEKKADAAPVETTASKATELPAEGGRFARDTSNIA